MPSTDFAFKASKDLTSVAAFFLIVPRTKKIFDFNLS